MNLKETVHWLMEQGYLVSVKGKYKVTAKFNKEMTGKEVGLLVLNGVASMKEPGLNTLTGIMNMAKGELSPGLSSNSIDWPQLYLNFIKEAEVPSSGEGRDGRYDLNKYSEPAMKAFRKAIESGVRYEVLVKSTMLYYKTRKQYPLKLGNYIEQGAWRSDYEALLSSAEDGTIINHIQKEIDETTEFSRFKLG